MWSHGETLPEQRVPEPQLDHFERMPKYVLTFSALSSTYEKRLALVSSFSSGVNNKTLKRKKKTLGIKKGT